MVTQAVNTIESLVVAPPEKAVRSKKSRLPLYRTIGFTLGLSVDFLWRARRGKFTLDAGDEMLGNWSKKIFRSGQASLAVRGHEKINPDQPFVVMSNHASLLDIPSMFAAWPGHLRMVLKEELTKVPVWGQALKGSGFIPIDRKNRVKAIRQLSAAKERINEGVSVWIAPEGTRSRDGSFARFKKGGFHLATQLDIPIVPVWIKGTEKIIPPDQFVVCYGGEVTVNIGEPISTKGRKLPELMTEVREAMLALR